VINARKTPELPAVPESEPATRPRRIVLAEDDSEMRRLLAQSLTRDGYEVVEVPDGSQLVSNIVDSLREGRPVDLVVSDVRMPGLGGFEAVAWLRELGCRSPVILITAFGDRSVHAEGVRVGAVRVLDKPFELDQLRQLVRELFAPPRARASDFLM
jgi:CheY-like chemotaxis protein